jgi:hypothetical protein
MRVQISGHPDDRHFADQLSDYLDSIGVDPKRDYPKPSGSAKSSAKLDQDLRRYDFMIALLSCAYLNDEWLMEELLQALVRERTDGITFLIPFQIDDCEVPPWVRDRVIDFRKAPFSEAIAPLASVLAAPRQVFVVMKFGDTRLESTYSIAIRPAIENSGFTPLRIDEVENAGSITEQTLVQIERSAVVLADLTGESPNCYFEAGYAHALGKQLILSIRKGEKIHFNLVDRRFIEWETEKELSDALHRRLESIRATMPAARALPSPAPAGG